MEEEKEEATESLLHSGVWDVVFIAYYETYLLYLMGIVFGTAMLITQDGAQRWLGLGLLVCGVVLPILQIWWRYRFASRLTPEERRKYYVERLEIQREKEDLGI